MLRLQDILKSYVLDGELYGVAVLSVEFVRKIGLNVTSSEPPIFHANVVGWPTDDDPDQQKGKRLEIALQLARAQTWISFTPPVA